MHALSGSRGSGNEADASPRPPALLTKAIVAHLLALKLQPAALLAVVPAATVEAEVTLSGVQVNVLRHQGNHGLGRQVRELTPPIPQRDRDEEEVHPGEPEQKLPLVLRHHHRGGPMGWVQVKNPGATGVP